MAVAAADVLKMLKDKDVKFVDLRFTDTRGKEQHVQVPVKQFTQDKFDSGHAFDGSSIAGWKGIEASDMLLMPDPDSARIDPFTDETTLNITCDVVEPSDGKGYDRDPRSLGQARRGVSQIHRPGRYRLFRAGARVLHLRLGYLERRYVRLLREDQVGGSSVVERRGVRGRQHGASRAGQGWLLPGAADRLAAGHPQRDFAGAGGTGRRGRSVPPRGRGCRAERDRHEVQYAGQARRLDADPQVHRAHGRAFLRQDGDLHAQAGRGRQRVGHARAPVGVEGRAEPVRGQRLRRVCPISRCITSAA